MPQHDTIFYNASKVDIKQTKDIVSKIMSFATFQDILTASHVCTIWNHACSKSLIIRLLKERWKYETFDYGSGCGVSFDIERMPLRLDNDGDIDIPIPDGEISSSSDIQTDSSWSSISLHSSRSNSTGGHSNSNRNSFNKHCFQENSLNRARIDHRYVAPTADNVCVQENWKQFLIAKEHLQINCQLALEAWTNFDSMSDEVSMMLTRLFAYTDLLNYRKYSTIKLTALNIESYRWLLQMFDNYMLYDAQIKTKDTFVTDSVYFPPKNVFPQIEVSEKYIDRMFDILTNNLQCMEIAQITTRAIGIIAINGLLICFDHLMSLITFFMNIFDCSKSLQEINSKKKKKTLITT